MSERQMATLSEAARCGSEQEMNILWEVANIILEDAYIFAAGIEGDDCLKISAADAVRLFAKSFRTTVRGLRPGSRFRIFN